jgi:mitochondrial fission protein ELM1
MEQPARRAVIVANATPPGMVESGPRTWAVSDARAGNLRQAQALADALDPGRADSCILQPQWPWRMFAPHRAPGSRHAFGNEFAALAQVAPSLAVGCGRQAALATRLLRMQGARAVQILDPRIASTHWDLVVVPRHDRLRGTNVLTMLGSLHPVDAAWLARARETFAAFAALPRPRTAVLLGGSSRHVRFDRMTFELLAGKLEAALARDGGSLLLTASRRSSRELRVALRHRYRETPGLTWLGPEDGDNPYAGMLAWADRIVCSPDSVNMISEACATNVPVHVFDPARAHGRLESFLDNLLACGRIRAVDARLAPFDVEPLRETARVAGEVRARLDLH